MTDAERKQKQKERNARRNHKAIYQRRVEKAIRTGHTGYAQHRKNRRVAQEVHQELTDRVIERLQGIGREGWLEEMESDPLFWSDFRAAYNRAMAA